MKRIFYNSDGEVVKVNYPVSRYLGGTFVNDLTKPIYIEVDDLTKPIMIKAADGSEGQSGNYEKKQEISGYEQRELTIYDCKIPDDIVQYTMKITADDLPEHEYTNQMIIVNDAITVDTDKSKTLMPLKFVHAKHLKALDESLNAELAKPSPDPIAALKLSQQKEAAKKLNPKDNEKELLGIALAGLDRSEIDKPLIRAKLEAKISELTSSEPLKVAKASKKKQVSNNLA